MLEDKFKKYLNEQHNLSINNVTPLSGGDINEVYLLKTTTQPYVIKVNNATTFPGMFDAEANGLIQLAKANTIRIPNIIAKGTYGNKAYILLEYIETGSQTADFWVIFGKQMAKMHQDSQVSFGFEQDNYIGSLPQYNKKEATASDFYIQQRLEPQFKLAHDSGFTFGNLKTLYKNLENTIPLEPSALVHGDLWSGNYLVDKQGNPVLIDPAVAYAPREMDIAMMHLFGGFNSQLFTTYNQIFPLQHNWKDRIQLWQLYYILVHVNIFGKSYYASAKEIVKRYS